MKTLPIAHAATINKTPWFILLASLKRASSLACCGFAKPSDFKSTSLYLALDYWAS